jgi:UDP-N-acetylmuramoyl-L-alanyl-D-glutamate--2,6-diaminopimelate ligase
MSKEPNSALYLLGSRLRIFRPPSPLSPFFMKSLLKKLLMYDRIFPIIKKSAIYRLYKKSIAQLASALNGNPSAQFTIIGVTGTDGKTTTCNLLHKILTDNLGKTVMVSTATIRIGDQMSTNTTKMTSLDAFQLQSLLATAKDQGCQYAILEVSSHGLEQYRFEGVEFDGAILTNITPEHLDYHGTMDNYAATKKVLFQKVLENQKNQKIAIFNKDSDYGRRRSEEMSFDTTLTYSISG